MGIRRVILNKVARWFLNRIPSVEPRQIQREREHTTSEELAKDIKSETTIASIAYRSENGSVAEDNQVQSPTESLGHPDIYAAEDRSINQVEAIPVQRLGEKANEPKTKQPARELKVQLPLPLLPPPPPPPHEKELRFDLDDRTEGQRISGFLDRQEGTRSPKKQIAPTQKPHEATELINILELTEDIENKLKELGINCVGDLEYLSADGIKELLDYDESSYTELIASLTLKGYRLPTSLGRSAGKSAASQEYNSEENDLIRFTRSKDEPVEKRFQIPEAPRQSPSFEWIPNGQSTQIDRTTLGGGLIYVGKSLPTIHGANDPCLIDPSKEVAESADFRDKLMGYWPNYSEISAEARRAYLNWLTDGKSDPSAYIGYVFLYFYGLERRIVIDCKSIANNETEIIEITNELQRLLAVFGKGSKSFKRYAEGLLDWISINYTKNRMYNTLSEIDPLLETWPQSIRLALGQAAVDKMSLPAYVALHWARMEATGPWTAQLAKRPIEFKSQFKKRYKEAFADGLLLPCNGNELRFTYVPASSGLVGIHELTIDIDGVPDVSITSEEKRMVLDILEKTCLEIDTYTSQIDKVGILETPTSTSNSLSNTPWTEKALRELSILKEQALSAPVAVQAETLIEGFKLPFTETKDHFVAICKQLRKHSLFVIPDVESGAAVPRLDDMVVLYLAEPIAQNTQQSARFHTANMALQLASAVAASDGDFCNIEHEHLLEQVRGWSHLDRNQLIHLEANLYYLKCSPLAFNAVRLNQLKKKLVLLDLTSRRSIAKFISAVAQADSRITAKEIKTCEKIYKALGLDAGDMLSALHREETSYPSLPSTHGPNAAKVSTKELELDLERIAQLQKDTDRGSGLLASIFTGAGDEEQATVVSTSQLTELKGPKGTDPSSILGLDTALSNFTRKLMEHTRWSRSELLAVARDLGLMLDGALESINEASYDVHDLPFSEGDDPVDINPDVLNKLNHE
jgi:hypothetical protein